MKLITLTLLSFATASSTLSLDPKNSDKFPDTEIQVEQLTPTEQLFKEVSEDFMMDGEPIHPGVLHEFYPDIWKCGGNPVTTINLSDISCYLNRINACHDLEIKITEKQNVYFGCGGTDSHPGDECYGYLLYKRIYTQDDGAHLLYFECNTGGSGIGVSYLLVKPVIKKIHKGTVELTSDDEQIYEIGEKEFIALELIGFYDQEPTFMEYEK